MYQITSIKRMSSDRNYNCVEISRLDQSYSLFCDDFESDSTKIIHLDFDTTNLDRSKLLNYLKFKGVEEIYEENIQNITGVCS